MVLLQRRWLGRQQNRSDRLRQLAADAAAAARWRTQRLIAMKKAGECGIEAAAVGVVWTERKAEEFWLEHYRSLQQLAFDAARRRGAELQLDWALGVVRKSVRRRVSKKRLFRTIESRQLKKLDDMSEFLLQSITDILVEGEEGSIKSRQSSGMPAGLDSLQASSSILRSHSSLSLSSAAASVPNRGQRRDQPPARRQGGRQARATAGMSAGYVPLREGALVGRGGTQLPALSTEVGTQRDRAALQLKSS